MSARDFVIPAGHARSPGRAGHHITLLARMNLVAACSACPRDLAPTNAGKLSDRAVRLS